jgi:hypothetical protein
MEAVQQIPEEQKTKIILFSESKKFKHMKKMMRIWGCALMMLMATTTFAQKIDEQRMERDIEVAENILSTLLRQQFDKQRMFFPLEVKGNYQPGYGVTFRLPADFTTPIVFSFDGMNNMDLVNPPNPGEYSYSYKFNDEEINDAVNEQLERVQERLEAEQDRIQAEQERIQEEQERIEEEHERINEEGEHNKEKQKGKHVKADVHVNVDAKPEVIVIKEKGVKPAKDVMRQKKQVNLDSIRDVYNAKMIEAAKAFLADYGDLISQLKPEERIIITNQGEQPRMWMGKLMNAPNRTHLSVEATKGDVSQFKQGKMSHDQFIGKVKVVNTQTVETVEPDLELLSSIFDRLYQSDLARTFFTEDRVYYERLKDFGVIYYMQVYSSHQNEYTFSMPTLKLRELDQKARDEKVKQLYPEFEKEIKENMLEYGRTVKSLKDNEVLVFNVKMTKCKGCAIPSSLEVSVKGSVLKDYSAGKMDKSAAISKMMIKKGGDQ